MAIDLLKLKSALPAHPTSHAKDAARRGGTPGLAAALGLERCFSPGPTPSVWLRFKSQHHLNLELDQSHLNAPATFPARGAFEGLFAFCAIPSCSGVISNSA